MTFARIYIARHERYEAAEAYVNRLTQNQIDFLKDNEEDFWLEVGADGKGKLLMIEDEG